ncbi:hypothetical protein [Sphingomonas lenta]|uniref:hypothetical protein n=1 Tax=Sphingomonas lenta TaxID=1141887 RepID=UPI001140BC07|nr:hypothetical protein [Sphingomonas lenta]
MDQLQSDTLAVLSRASELLDEEPGPARAGLGAIRRELARKLREYQIFKHSRIFDPALTSGSPSVAEAGRRLKVDCIAGSARFDQYVREWSGKDIAAEWAAFRSATLELGRRLRDHMVSERVQIRLLLAGATPRQNADLGE